MIDRRSWRIGFYEGLAAMFVQAILSNVLDVAWWAYITIALLVAVALGALFVPFNTWLEERAS